MHKPVYITPMSIIGITIYHIMKYNKTGDVYGFLDSDSSLYGMNYDNTRIFPFDDEELNKNGIVIVCSLTYGREITDKLQRFGFKRVIFAYQFIECEKISEIINNYDIDKNISSFPKTAQTLKKVREKGSNLRTYIKYFYADSLGVYEKDSLVLKMLEIVVTERCTLKCRDCANLMQYYQYPKDIDADSVCHSLDLFMEFIDMIKVVNILGGEPFIYNDLSEILRYIKKYEHKVCSYQIVTNATVIPKKKVLEIIKENNFHVKISDYKQKTQKVDELVKILERYFISYSICNDNWYECRKILDWHGLPDKKHALNVFSTCGSSCRTLKGNKLFYCPFIAHGHELMAIPNEEENYIEIYNITKRKLNNYINRRKPLPGCLYCSGIDRNKKCIQAGLQIKEPISYKILER